MKDIDPDKVIYTRPYIPRWAKIGFIITLAPAVIMMGFFLLMTIVLAVAML